MNQPKHESILFWQCENNCGEVLISQAVSEHILWADSRDKPISLLLAPAPNSLWLTGQSTGACRGAHTHTYFADTPLSHFAPQPQTGGNPPQSPTLQSFTSKNYLKTNPVCVCVYVCPHNSLSQTHGKTITVSLVFN